MTGAQPHAGSIGPYRIVRPIGTGGTAQVYEGRAPGGSAVAVKLLSAAIAPDSVEAITHRFRHEVEVLGRLRHPNVVEILDAGTDEAGRPYLVTPLLEGTTLRALTADGPLLPEVALLILDAACAGAAALHAAHLVHRDLKPENLMLCADGRVVIIDLGIAIGPELTRLTDEGAVVGSVPYMAPQQIEGAAATPATDVWALGVMAYEWVAGRRPFARERQSEEVAAILSGRYPPLGEVDRRAPEAYCELVDRCLRFEPYRRPKNGAALGGLIEPQLDWLDASPDQARAALARAPAAYASGVIAVRVDRAVAEAVAARDAGDAFAAARALDRGLAYAPEHPALHELANQPLAAPALLPPAQPETPAPPQPAPRRRLGGIAIAAGALMLASVIAVVAMSSGEAPETAADGETDTAAETDGETETAAGPASATVTGGETGTAAATTPTVWPAEAPPAPDPGDYDNPLAPTENVPIGQWQHAQMIFLPP
jgi:tRNA A-37 threonylcarbamoyl transferase component Bud32